MHKALLENLIKYLQVIEINISEKSFGTVFNNMLRLFLENYHVELDSNDEIIDMFGNPENKERLEWKENDSGSYKYGLRAISYTNSLGNTTTDIDYNPDPSDSTDHSDTSHSKIYSIPLMGLCILLILLF